MWQDIGVSKQKQIIMKHFIFLLTLLIPVVIFVSGQSTDEKAMRKMIDEMAIAMKIKDVAKLDSIYAIDYTYISPSSGVMSNKSERLSTSKITNRRVNFILRQHRA